MADMLQPLLALLLSESYVLKLPLSTPTICHWEWYKALVPRKVWRTTASWLARKPINATNGLGHFKAELEPLIQERKRPETVRRVSSWPGDGMSAIVWS